MNYCLKKDTMQTKIDRKKTIGERLLRERQRFGWSQMEAAAKACVSFSAYRSYEDGRSAPNAEALQLLADSGIDVLYIITGSEGTGGIMSPDEMMVLNYWRDSPDELRAAWLAFYRAYGSAIRREEI